MTRVLLVDDDPQFLESGKDILIDAGYSAESAATLKEARTILSARPIRILVVDFNLPDGKGLTLAQEAKSQQPGLILILMTGELVELNDEERKIFHAVLTKPVDPAAFLALLGNSLCSHEKNA